MKKKEGRGGKKEKREGPKGGRNSLEGGEVATADKESKKEGKRRKNRQMPYITFPDTPHALKESKGEQGKKRGKKEKKGCRLSFRSLTFYEGRPKKKGEGKKKKKGEGEEGNQHRKLSLHDTTVSAFPRGKKREGKEGGEKKKEKGRGNCSMSFIKCRIFL